MDSTELLVLVRYHAWANRRIVATAAALTDDEFHGAAPLDHGTAFDTFRHLLDAGWSWREYLTGRDVGETYVWDHGIQLDDLPAITAFCAEEDERLERYVASLDAAALHEEVPIGPDDRAPRWVILAHVVNHGTQHRSELARYLTDRDHSPDQLDLIDAFTELSIG
jgi:uncharacterized damage-inducible protein DinB